MEEIGEEALAEWKAYEERELKEGNFTCPAEEKQKQEARDAHDAIKAGDEQSGEQQTSLRGNADNASKDQDNGVSGPALSIEGANDDHSQHQQQDKGKGRASNANANANEHQDNDPFGPAPMDGANDDPPQSSDKGKGRASNDDDVFCVDCHNFMRQQGYMPDFCEYCEEHPGCDICHSDLRRNSAGNHGHTQNTQGPKRVPARIRAAPAATVVTDAPAMASAMDPAVAPAVPPAAPAAAAAAATAGRAPATSCRPAPATGSGPSAQAGPSSRSARTAVGAERTVPRRQYDRLVRLIADQHRRMIRLNAYMQTAFASLTYRIQAIVYRPDASLFFDLPSINGIAAELMNLFAVARQQESQFINVFDEAQRFASINAMHIDTLENLFHNAAQLERRIWAIERVYFYRAYGGPASDPRNGDNINGNANNDGDANDNTGNPQ